MEINYLRILKKLQEEYPDFQGISNGDYNADYFSNKAIISISHLHYDHWMGLINPTLPIYHLNKELNHKIKFILPIQSIQYINDFQGYINKENEIINSFFNNNFVANIRELCVDKFGIFKNLGEIFPPQLDEHHKIDVIGTKDREVQMNCVWESHFVHAGHGLSIDTSIDEHKRAIFLYDLYPPFVPFSTTVFPRTNMSELIELYKKIKKEIEEEKIDLIFWSHRYKYCGNYYDKEKLVNFTEDIENFIKMFKDIKEQFHKNSNHITIDEIIKFCKRVTHEFIEGLIKTPINSDTIEIFYALCRFDSIKYTRGEEYIEIKEEGKKSIRALGINNKFIDEIIENLRIQKSLLFPVLLFSIFVLNIILDER